MNPGDSPPSASPPPDGTTPAVPTGPQLVSATKHLGCCLGVVSLAVGVWCILGSLLDGMVPPILGIVFVAGCLGGLVSVHSRMLELPHQRMQALSSSLVYASVTGLVGGILAVAVYLFLMTEPAKGPAFPIFSQRTPRNPDDAFDLLMHFGPKEAMDSAKCIVWGFAAGFAEGIVNKFIARMWRT